MSGDATLEAIDGALRDWGMSQDAMRWTPEPTPVGDGAERPQVLVTIDTSQAVAALQHLSRQLQQLATTTIGPLVPTLRNTAEAFAPLLKSQAKAAAHLLHAYDAAQRPRWHRRRCATCNPAGNPPPLAGKFKSGPKAARMRRRNR